MEQIFNPCGEFRWSLEGPVSQIHSPYLHVGPLGFFKICSDAKERVGWGKQREATAPIQSLVKLQLWLLNLRWKTCHRQKYSLDSCACSEEPIFALNTLIIINMPCFWWFVLVISSVIMLVSFIYRNYIVSHSHYLSLTFPLYVPLRDSRRPGRTESRLVGGGN